ncbi:hypothetical protein [Streptomyces osmaniensis]|uniref:hypothetical protein n=1 Tax=Streptomyces osmaniensis TaxID=593134 RepID=UPI001C3379CB|nr:hypothetical protein KJK32_43655 [Streptomyces sp. JCM17656]
MLISECHSDGPPLELAALLVLLGLSAAVYVWAGPAAVTAVSGVGAGLFATWRSRPRPPRR